MANLQQKRQKIMFIMWLGIFFILSGLQLQVQADSSKTQDIATAESVSIVATIKPIYNLIAPIISGVENNKVTLLLANNSSPHDYQLKPGDLKLLKQADLIVWGGGSMESFLAKLLNQSKFSSKSLSLESIPKISKLLSRNSCIHTRNTEHTHTHYIDGHFWLSPTNAKIIVQALKERLSSIDPSSAHIYSQNTQKFINELDELDKKIQTKLSHVSQDNYLVFHDAYQYFEKHYGLTEPIIISDNPAIPLSAKRLLTISKSIRDAKAGCIFKEPQFSSKTIDVLLTDEDLNGRLKTGILDPLGTDQDLGVDGYLKLINNLADQFYSCFKG